MLKFGLLVPYRSPEAVQWLKSTYLEIQDDGRPSNFQSLNRYNSAADSSISLNFGTEFDHVTADTLQSTNVQGDSVTGQDHSVP